MRYKDPNNVSKQKILLESFKLFATKPFSDITFTDIEKVTGLSRGAILYHFKSKDEILASIIDRFIINKEYDLPTIDVSKSMWDNIKNFIAVKQRQQEFFTSIGIQNIIMKSKISMLLFVAAFAAACTNEMEEFAKDSFENVPENASLTRSCLSDTIDLGELVSLEETEELKELKARYEKMYSNNRKVQALDATVDDFFSSNIYAIRELPVTIKVRTVASGSTTSNSYLFCDGAGKEVTLGNSSTSLGSRFYLKILPATSGIPYLIYSSASNTPLSVGYYTNAPDDKILMTAKDNSGSLYSAGWDLIPSTYKGYFSIQSESYLGQSDPNNSWSVFYHVLEAKANNKLGYAQRVNYRAQQEFLITPTASFTLQNVTFDLENATISNGAVISKVTSLTNVHEYTTNENLTINFNAEETSNFYETAGTLKVNISSPSSIKFPRPRPIAGKAVLMGDESKDAIYSSATQKLSAPVEYSTSIEMKPRCLLQLTTKFKTFILNVPYVAVAKYGDREIKVRGTWRGYSVADPELNKPINEPHYFDLETGEELNYSLSFDPERKIYVTK